MQFGTATQTVERPNLFLTIYILGLFALSIVEHLESPLAFAADDM